jgi:uncharacterized protein (TIGR02246 family)
MLTSVRAISCILVAASAMLAQNGSAADEQLIRKLLSDFASARNALDAKKLASTFAEDGQYTGSDQFLFSGRLAIESMWAQTFAEFPNGRAARTIHSVRFIDSDIAVADVDVSVTGFPKGGLATVPKLMDICVLSKKSGEWKIAEAWTVSTQ